MPRTPTPTLDERARRHLAIAQRVADAHRGIDDASLLSFVSGSTVDNLVDELSDVDMSVVFARLPGEATLRAACRSAAGQPVSPGHAGSAGDAGTAGNADEGEWTWSMGQLDDPAEGGVVSFRIDGIEVQIVHRDAPLWSREIQIEACYALLHALCGLNRRWFTRFQVKRMQRLADKLALAPARLAPRIEALLLAPPREAFDALHALEAEVLALVATHMPEVDLAPVQRRHRAYEPVAS